jgi:hypothetical protein
MKNKKIKLQLNKETIAKLNAFQLGNLRGGEDTALTDDTTIQDPDGNLAFLSLWGSNCYDTNPGNHACCRDSQEGTAHCTVHPDPSGPPPAV